MIRPQMKKRTEISIEIDEVIVVSASGKDIQRNRCPTCTGEAMVTPEEAAALTGVTVRSLYARVEGDGVHFLETADGSLLLFARWWCLNLTIFSAYLCDLLASAVKGPLKQITAEGRRDNAETK